MARIKLKIPAYTLFSTRLPVRINDINYGNHLGNNQLVGLLHEARVQWLTHHGFSELNAGGVALIMAELTVTFKQQAYYPDVLQVQISSNPIDIGRSSFDLYYEVTKNSAGNNILVAVAKTIMVCYDYQKKKTVQMPPKLKEIIS